MSGRTKQPRELCNVEAEASLIGAALISGRQILLSPTVAAVRPSDFWDHRHRDIWAAILKVVEDGTEPDQVTVADELYKRGQLEAVGGAAGLLTAVNSCANWTRADRYAAVVLDWSRRRRVQRAISDLGAALYKDGDFRSVLRETLDALSEVALQGTGPVEHRTMAEIRGFFGDVTWAWPRWIPTSHLTLIVGTQGCGKSYLAARLVATFTGHIERWPDGTEFQGLPHNDEMPAKVLLVETEELRGVYAERLEKMNVGEHWVIFGPGDETHIPDLLREADQVERLARDEEVGAIIVDSLSGGHELKENSTEMRKLLKRYAAMASRLHIAVLLVHHVRKRGELEPTKVTLDRVRGSSTITQFCRSVIALYRLEEGDQTAPVRMECIKSTFCAPAQPMGFVITGAGLEFCDAPEPAREESQLDRACELLLALLRDGPVASIKLQEEADGAGVSWDTMKRAKRRLGVVARRDGKEKRWYWALPANA